MTQKKKMQKIDLESFFINSDHSSREEEAEEQEKDIDPSAHRLLVRKEKKGRKGKVVSIVEGFEGTSNQREELTRAIKQFCGSGGSVKDNQIIIQGDKCDQIVRFLTNRGFIAKKTTM